MTATQLGARSASTVVAVGVTYAVVLAIGMVRHGLSEPIADPILAVMELLTIASALPLLSLFVALHACALPGARNWATLALCCAAMFAFSTIGVHFVELTSGRATGSHGLVWPSATYAIELLAWDLLLGLALVLSARALPDDPRSRRLGHWLSVTGALCLAGLIGPFVGDMRLQLIGVFGYAVLLPIVAWVSVGWFRAPERRDLLPPPDPS